MGKTDMRLSIKLSKKLDKKQEALKNGKSKVQLQCIGERLYLRATLPPKSGETEVKRRRIALGLRITEANIDIAYSKALLLHASLISETFDWKNWGEGEVDTEKTTVELVSDFKEYYFSCRQRNHKTELTWDKDYRQPLSRLKDSDVLNSESLRQVIINNSKPDSRSRKRYCVAYNAFAKFLGIEVGLRDLRGNYSHKKTGKRIIPSDELIFQEIRHFEIDSGWDWIYGMLACYGLRPHEIAFVKPFKEGQVVCRLGEGGKTGARIIYPFPIEWFNYWDLSNRRFPNIQINDSKQLARTIAQKFKRCNIPFKPYDLRHAWAIRSMRIGLDVSLAAQQMGHSLQIHSETYHRWISEQVHQEAFDKLTKSKQ